MNQDYYDYEDYPPSARVNPNDCILELNSVIISSLITKLDSADHTKNWRALIDALPDTPYTLLDVEWFANKRLEKRSPSKALLASLGNHGRTVEQLIYYLKRIENEPALLLLQTPSEDICIIQQPVGVTIDEGRDSTASFSCHARGFPFPRYQWFKACQSEAITVPNGNHRVLKINPVTKQDAGFYSCRVHNDREGRVVSYCFTHWAELKVEIAQEFMMSTLEVTKHPLSVTADVGNEIVLECSVICQFKPWFQWYIMKSDGENLAPVAIPGKTNQKLVFKQVNVNDSGHYKCKIESGREKIWTYFAKVEVVPKRQYNPESKIPVIVRHPVSMDQVMDNDTVVLACEAYGEGPLFYQWYKNGEMIQAATWPEYRIEAMKPEHYGEYFCVVRNRYQDVQSNIASVHLPIIQNPIYATDKVALLIGNQSYRNLHKLLTPQKEVENLGISLLQVCGFKLITLIDLTKKEIEFAVSMFCNLLAEGMYGVFFFSGHGFENDGHSFLIPVDCSSGHKIKDCVDTQWILDQMQVHKTALNLILLDICRIRNDYQDQKVDDKLHPDVRGNTVFGYAAAANCEAFEAPGEDYSVFAKHLLLNINRRERIERVLEKVKKGVQNDTTSRGKQYPTIYSDLVEDRGLLDPVNSQGQTKLFNKRVMQWEEAHGKVWNSLNFTPILNLSSCIGCHTEADPGIWNRRGNRDGDSGGGGGIEYKLKCLFKKKRIHIDVLIFCQFLLFPFAEIDFEGPLIRPIGSGFDYFVHIDIRIKTSNIMNILVVIINDLDQRCNVQLQHFPPELDVKVTKDYEPGYEGKVLKTTVSGLQRLKGKLQPVLFIEWLHEKELHRWMRMLDLGTPLVSKIWQSRDYKHPTESSYPDYDLPGHQGRGIANSNSLLKEISEELQAVSISSIEPKPIQTEPKEGSVHKEEPITEESSTSKTETQ
ncbi:mucosa-associated lymphoid tissue lymphoma translocation protein 1-like [Anneissia japonica]|uniref:mucosa-associated lymphoid tissue lymphoma translocation protein 1-like n=1 Tax=Anneissia japonica TaxID=1529436 RepID=UPI0014259608|nr:mucosa-associated lymphoid tissue lymphoma translocation protein 1-like [Anneissia japonica]